MKKVLSLLFVGILFIGVGCSSNQDNTKLPKKESKKESNVIYNGTYGPIVKDKITLSLFFNDNANTPSDDKEIWKQLEKDLNVDIEHTANPNAKSVDDYNLHAIDGFPSDIVGGSKIYADAQRYAEQGAFYPLHELEHVMPNFHAYLNKPENAEIKAAIMGMDGEYYIIPNLNPPATYIIAGTAMFIRQDWLEKLGLEVPQTTEELEQVLSAFRDRDANGNGLKDEIPLVGNLNKTYASLPTLFGARTRDKEPTNGKMIAEGTNVQHAWFTEEMKNAIIELSRWYDEGLIDPEFITFEGDPLANYFPNDLAGVTYEPLYWGGRLNYRDDAPEGFNLVGMLPPVNKVTNERMYNDERFRLKDHGWAISSSSKNPEAAAAFLDTFFTEEGHDLIGFGIKDIHYDDIETKQLFGKDFRVPHYIGEIGTEIYQEGKTRLTAVKERGGRLPLGLENDYELGYGNLDEELPASYNTFALYDEAKKSGELKSGEYLPLLNGFMTSDERDEVAKLKSSVDSYAEENYHIFLTIPYKKIDDKAWNAYIEDAKKLGLDKLEKIYTTAYARYLEANK